MDPNEMNLLIAAIVIALVAVAGWMYFRKTSSERLAKRFGPEYQRTVDQLGRGKAEAELAKREQRVRKLKIVPLAPAEAARFEQSWKALQSRFVDDPKAALAGADRLVRELMQARGYPMTDLDRCAADLSVDHAGVIEHFRAASAIVFRNQNGQANTEHLRQAIVHYRALFDDLIEVAQPLHQASHPESLRRI